MSFTAYVLPLLLLVPFGAGVLLFALGKLQTLRTPVEFSADTPPPPPEPAPPTPLHPAARLLAYTGFCLPALYAVALCALFANAVNPATGYAWLAQTPLEISWLGVSLMFGLNGLSLPLFTLAALVGAAAGIQAIHGGADNKPAFLALLLFMLGAALAMFASVDVFFFYFFHETALIPAFLLLLYWGGQGRRTAAIQMAVYLTFGAMATLAGILLLALKSGTTNLILLKAVFATAPLAAPTAGWIFGLLLLGFGVSAALFPFHSWAPAAYTEAPAPASMLLAGVFRQFGPYGLLQLGALLAPAGLVRWAPVLLWLALGNVVVIGVITLGQRHLKDLFSYATVAQAGLCFLGVYACVAGGAVAQAGAGAAVFLMFGNGLATAALFLLGHGVWQRTGALEFGSIGGGLAQRAPVLAAFFVAAAMAFLGLPGFAGFWGELGVFTALSGAGLATWQLALVGAGVAIAAVTMLRAVAAVFFGPETAVFKARVEAHPVRDIAPNERAAAGLLLAAALVAGFWPRLFGDALAAALQP
ncbi:MAG: NADH-quinone oxidoreductase subunit M [Puniceicoccales bacterium]|jgi:NADH-quinone oxidoreductase subunit M|nr:NADH-quinone oxidoreductase subunit M [Puniceicoccales bacterium]